MHGKGCESERRAKKKRKEERKEERAPPESAAGRSRGDQTLWAGAARGDPRGAAEGSGCEPEPGRGEGAGDGNPRWIQRSRALQREKELAEKRAKLLEEMDQELGVSPVVEEEFQRRRLERYSAGTCRS
ncbi:unnamed protein product [Coccothraustes coccothraustes]